MGAESVGSLGQCSKTEANGRADDGNKLPALTVLTTGNQGGVPGKADPIHKVVQVGNQGREEGKSDPNHEVA